MKCLLVFFFCPFSVDHLVDTPVLVPRSSSSAKVKVKYQGNIFFKKEKSSLSGIGVSLTHCDFLLVIELTEIELNEKKYFSMHT